MRDIIALKRTGAEEGGWFVGNWQTNNTFQWLPVCSLLSQMLNRPANLESRVTLPALAFHGIKLRRAVVVNHQQLAIWPYRQKINHLQQGAVYSEALVPVRYLDD